MWTTRSSRARVRRPKGSAQSLRWSASAFGVPTLLETIRRGSPPASVATPHQQTEPEDHKGGHPCGNPMLAEPPRRMQTECRLCRGGQSNNRSRIEKPSRHAHRDHTSVVRRLKQHGPRSLTGLRADRGCNVWPGFRDKPSRERRHSRADPRICPRGSAAPAKSRSGCRGSPHGLAR